jgi:hypothetical protein
MREWFRATAGPELFWASVHVARDIPVVRSVWRKGQRVV